MNNKNKGLETRFDVNQSEIKSPEAMLEAKAHIFKKKVNLKHKIIPLDIITNTIGPVRFFPPATKEWFNSIYTYNKNSLKNLSIADKTIMKLIRSYFNLSFKKNILRSKRILRRLKRLSLNKIFISKPELKHTNSNVNITLYVYNEEKRALDRKLKNLEKLHFVLSNKGGGSVSKAPTRKFSWEKLSLMRFLNKAKKYQNRVSLVDYLERLQLSIFFRLALYKRRAKASTNRRRELTIIKLASYLKKITKMIILSKRNMAPSLSTSITKSGGDKAHTEVSGYTLASERLDQIYLASIRKALLYKDIKEIATCKLLLDLNKSKFEDKYLNELKSLISQIYDKNVEFNIVNLKTLYFNSDIFTQAVSMRIKNRKNSLLRVLKSSLHLVKLPVVNKIRERYGVENKPSLDHLKNVHINSVINRYNTNKDTLDSLLLDIMPYSSVSSEAISHASSALSNPPFNTENTSTEVNTSSVSSPLDLVISSLKYKATAGVRLETKGRLTKRFTASRSVFKVKWKGSIKNLDSSYKGLSSVMLRGHVKSNLDYTNINTKTRNGSFGLKGWISSK